jgi:hypothetical protein
VAPPATSGGELGYRPRRLKFGSHYRLFEYAAMLARRLDALPDVYDSPCDCGGAHVDWIRSW